MQWLRRNKQQSEHRDGAGYIRSYRAESITNYGHPSGPLLHQQMQAGTQSGFVTLGLLALIFTVGSYLAVATRLAVIWDRTRWFPRLIPLAHEHDYISGKQHSSASRSPMQIMGWWQYMHRLSLCRAKPLLVRAILTCCPNAYATP